MNIPLPPISVDGVVRYLRELTTVLEEMQRPTLQYYILDELHVVPKQLRDNMVVLADGSNWDPGSGKGTYRYIASTNTWQFIG